MSLIVFFLVQLFSRSWDGGFNCSSVNKSRSGQLSFYWFFYFTQQKMNCHAKCKESYKVFQTLVFLPLNMLLLLDFTIALDFYSYYNLPLLYFISYNIQLATWIIVCILMSHWILALLFSTTLCGICHFDCDMYIVLWTDVPLHYSSHLVMAVNAQFAYFHLTSGDYVLDCLRGILA